MTLLLSCLGISLGITIQGFTPSLVYVVVTGVYFLTMEPLVEACLPRLLALLAPDSFDGQERLWAPVVLKSTSLLVSLVMTSVGLVLAKYKAAALAGLLCVHLKIRDIQLNGIQPIRIAEATVTRYLAGIVALYQGCHLKIRDIQLNGIQSIRIAEVTVTRYLAVIAVIVALYQGCHLNIRDIQLNGIQPIRIAEATVTRFPFATSGQISSCDDVCAICLAEMRRARVT